MEARAATVLLGVVKGMMLTGTVDDVLEQAAVSSACDHGVMTVRLTGSAAACLL